MTNKFRNQVFLSRKMEKFLDKLALRKKLIWKSGPNAGKPRRTKFMATIIEQFVKKELQRIAASK